MSPRRDHRDDGAEFRARYVPDPATGCYVWTGNRFRRPTGEQSYARHEATMRGALYKLVVVEPAGDAR